MSRKQDKKSSLAKRLARAAALAPLVIGSMPVNASLDGNKPNFPGAPSCQVPFETRDPNPNRKNSITPARYSSIESMNFTKQEQLRKKWMKKLRKATGDLKDLIVTVKEKLTELSGIAEIQITEKKELEECILLSITELSHFTDDRLQMNAETLQTLIQISLRVAAILHTNQDYLCKISQRKMVDKNPQNFRKSCEAAYRLSKIFRKSCEAAYRLNKIFTDLERKYFKVQKKEDLKSRINELVGHAKYFADLFNNNDNDQKDYKKILKKMNNSLTYCLNHDSSIYLDSVYDCLDKLDRIDPNVLEISGHKFKNRETLRAFGSVVFDLDSKLRLVIEDEEWSTLFNKNWSENRFNGMTNKLTALMNRAISLPSDETDLSKKAVNDMKTYVKNIEFRPYDTPLADLTKLSKAFSKIYSFAKNTAGDHKDDAKNTIMTDAKRWRKSMDELIRNYITDEWPEHRMVEKYKELCGMTINLANDFCDKISSNVNTKIATLLLDDNILSKLKSAVTGLRASYHIDLNALERLSYELIAAVKYDDINKLLTNSSDPWTARGNAKNIRKMVLCLCNFLGEFYHMQKPENYSRFFYFYQKWECDYPGPGIVLFDYE